MQPGPIGLDSGELLRKEVNLVVLGPGSHDVVPGLNKFITENLPYNVSSIVIGKLTILNCYQCNSNIIAYIHFL